MLKEKQAAAYEGSRWGELTEDPGLCIHTKITLRKQNTSDKSKLGSEDVQKRWENRQREEVKHKKSRCHNIKHK